MANVYQVPPNYLVAKGPGPSLQSVRRMRNLISARDEINPRPVGVDGIRLEAYKNPLTIAAGIPISSLPTPTSSQ